MTGDGYMNCKYAAVLSGVILSVFLSSCNGRSPDLPSKTDGTPTTLAEQIQIAKVSEIPFAEADAAFITLSDEGIEADGAGVSIDGAQITIREGGSYILSGTLSDGSLVIDCGKSQEVSILLRDAHISSADGAALYVISADAVRLYTDENTQNSLASSYDFSLEADSNVDAALFSKEDLYLSGAGTLSVVSTYGHGIVSKDDLTVLSGSYTVQSASHGISGKDSVTVLDGQFSIDSGKDGIHAENKDDESLGNLYLADGIFHVAAIGDGLSASAAMQIDGGSYTLTTGGGAAFGEQHTDEKFGGDRRGWMSGWLNDSSQNMEQTDDSAAVDSAKGIKAQTALYITSGTFAIDAADDALHSNGDLSIADGSFQLSTGDDGMHADNALSLLGGDINIAQSYEGLEGTAITLSGGHVSVTASDDGINAAGGADGSGFLGFGGGRDMFSSDGVSAVVISGGYLYLNADGDGLDSNGDLTISGGEIFVDGPTNGANGAVDCAGEAIITGGTLIAVGSSQMAEGFDAASTQGVALVTLQQTQNAAALALYDGNDNLLLSHTPQKSYNSVYVSCPEMIVGKTYTLVTGSLQTEIAMNDTVVGSSGFGMGGFGGGNGNRGDRGDMGQIPGGNGTRGERPDIETDENGNPMIPEMPEGGFGFGGKADDAFPGDMTPPEMPQDGQRPNGMAPGGQMPGGSMPQGGFGGMVPPGGNGS